MSPSFDKLGSIYTCSQYPSHQDPTDNQLAPNSPKSFSRPFKRHHQTRDGPWFMDLENVLERRDQSRAKTSRREQRKTAARRIKRAQARSSLAAVNSERESANSADDEQDKDHQSTTIITPKGLQTPLPANQASTDRPARDPNPRLAYLPQQVQSVLPSSSLLSAIHHTATSLYTQKGIMDLPPVRLGRKPKDWKEPVAMGQALHGSALMAIGILLEEIVKQADPSST